MPPIAKAFVSLGVIWFGAEVMNRRESRLVARLDLFVIVAVLFSVWAS